VAAPLIVGQSLRPFVTIATADCTVRQHYLYPARSLCVLPSVTRRLRSPFRKTLNKTCIRIFRFFLSCPVQVRTGRCMSKGTITFL